MLLNVHFSNLLSCNFPHEPQFCDRQRKSKFLCSVELEVLVGKTAPKSSLPQRGDILPAHKEALWEGVTNIVNTFGHQRSNFNEEESAGTVEAQQPK